MARRLIAAIVCVFIANSGVGSIYAASHPGPEPDLKIERFYASLDPLEDFGDQQDSDDGGKRAAQNRVGVKLDLGAKVKKIRFKQSADGAVCGGPKPLSYPGEPCRHQTVLRI